jgi:hypothetical protein
MKRAALFLIPPLICLFVFWDVLFTWFLFDDFAWLGLRLELHNGTSLARILFEPQAQGTVRFLSERVFFLIGTSLFGIHAVPFRIVGLATWFLVLALASVIGTRLTGSRAAGVAAAVFWTTSYAVVRPLAWSSSYNQLLCSLLVLCAFYARLRWLDSNDNHWRVAEWAPYLLAFGALEIVVMYPAAALLYTWCVSEPRQSWSGFKEKSVLALFLPAVAFAAMHSFLVPKNLANIYTIRIDSKLPSTLLTYIRWALGPSRLQELNVPDWSTAGMAATWLIGLTLAAFVLWSLRKGDREPAFCVAWFLLFLIPVLPLPNHISDYYLTLPLAGLSWLAGWALVRAWRSNLAVRVIGVSLAIAFLAGSIEEISLSTAWFRSRAGRMRVLYRAMEQASASHPGTALMFQHVDNELFQSGFQDDPFRLVGISRVYLAPGTEKGIQARQDLGGISRFTIAPEEALRLLNRHELAVLDVGGPTPQDTTVAFAAVLSEEIAHSTRNFVDVGSALYLSKVGPEWYRIENGSRWMPKRATVELAAPRSAAERLYITGYGPAAALASGPFTLTFLVKGKQIGAAAVTEPNGPFAFDLPLPPGLIGQPLPLTIEASKTFHTSGDPRELSIILGTVEIK